MELVSINSEDEYNNLMKIISESKYPRADYWTSGTDFGNEGNFFWATNGNNFNKVTWHRNQPDNYQNMENCVQLSSWDNSYKLNDSVCDTSMLFICTSV